MEAKPGVVPAEVRLKRFLHYGSETPLCIPRNRNFQDCFLLEKLTAIEEMLANCTPEEQGEAVNHILKAFMDGYSGYPECLVFALAACACQKSSEPLRCQAYSAVKKICKTPEDLFLFTTFTKRLSSPTAGYGKGWRRALSEWYLSKEPMDLAACVTQTRGAYGYTHKDLFKLTHIKTCDKAKAAIICYVMKGLEASKLLPDNDDNTDVQKVLTYLQTVQDVKHQEDAQSCACMLELHNLSIDVVPHNLLKSIEIWMVLVPRMSIRDLLESLIRLSCYGFLKSGQPLEALITDRLCDQAAIVEAHLHPSEVFCILKRYENDAKNTHDFLEKLIKQGKTERQLKPPPKPNAKIIEALKKLLVSTFKLLVPTGQRYLVAVDLSSNMQIWRCNGSRDVKPAQAATLLALCLLHAEREVTVAVFPPSLCHPPEEGLDDVTNATMRDKKKLADRVESQGMIPVILNKELSVEENLEKMCETISGPVEVCLPILWAQQTQKQVDVFIVLTDYVTIRKRSYKEPSAALEEYRQQMKLPNSKLVTCALVSNTLDVAAGHDVGMLDIVGFNGKTARMIEAFSRGAF